MLNGKVLADHRILVVEDDPLIAMVLADILRDCGAEVAGPAAKLEEATRLATMNGLSAALLDIRLNGVEVWPAAQILADKEVPFIFCSGHFDSHSLPSQWRSRPILSKPVSAKQVVAAMVDLIGRRPPA